MTIAFNQHSFIWRVNDSEANKQIFARAERLYTVAVQKYHYNNLKPFLNITLEEAEQNGKIRVLSTSARDVVEEYLTVNQHLSREVEGRLVVEA